MSGPNIHIPLFKAYSARELVALFESMNEEIRVLDNYLALDILPVTKLIRHYSAQLKQLVALNDSKETKEISEACTKKVQQVVTHLQVHDTIAQKLDHIHLLHKEIILELCQLKDINQFSETRYLAVMLEIIVMNREQLLLIKEEYRVAVEAIQENLEKIETKIKWLSATSIQLPSYFFHYQQFEKMTEQICLNMLAMVNEINTTYSKDIQKEQKLKNIANIFTMDSERWILDKIVHGGAARHRAGDVQKKLDVDQTELF